MFFNEQTCSQTSLRAHRPLCKSTAAPDAEIHWILPGRHIVSHAANTSRAFVFSNGSLGVPQGLPSDCGCYKCVAVNRHGVATLAMEVNVTRHPGRGEENDAEEVGVRTPDED
ncbi:unnamed protein product [Boreogadus saida]